MSEPALMRGKTALVTGGTGGIGQATATGLAGLGARVGLVGRSATRGAAAADAVRRHAPSAEVDVFEADLSEQAEVRRLAAEVEDTYPRLDVLINKGKRSYNGQRAYSQSKLANVLFTYELARRLEGTRVTATVLHPGVVRTAFGREDSGRFMRMMFPLVTPFMKTPEQGAVTPIHLASSPDVAGVTGVYFANRRPKRSSGASYDRDLARRLWEASAELTGVTEVAR